MAGVAAARRRRAARATVHAKHPGAVGSPWVRRRLVRTGRTPEWGSIDLVHVMMALLRAALASSPPVTHVQFLSETCIPVRALPDTLRRLAPGLSWLDVADRPRNGYAALRQFSRVQRPGRVLKSDQWSLLCREHAQHVLHEYDKDPELTEFLHVQAADEIFIPTVLGPPPCRIHPAKAVYVDWSVSCKHPRSFDHHQVPRALARARELGALFLRKVPKPVAFSAWDAWRRPAATPCTNGLEFTSMGDLLRHKYPNDEITEYNERIWPESECWQYVYASHACM